VEVGVAHGFRRVDRDQPFLLPPDLREWLPEGHLARFVVEVVDQLDLSEVRAGYRLGGQGRQAYDPAMLTGLLLYGYATGERSSRRLERACVNDIACRYIAANQTPDHATIARFRAAHQQALSGLFGQVLALAVDAGLIDTQVLAVDATRIAANASMDANIGPARLAELAEQVLVEAAEIDAAEDQRYGQRRGDEPAPGWEPGPKRAAKIRHALAELAAQQPEGQTEIAARQAQRIAQGKKPRGGKRLPADPTKPGRLASRATRQRVNLTDPSSRLMKGRRGFLQGYSGQAVATTAQIIVAATLTNDAGDHRALRPMLDLAIKQLTDAGHLTPPTTLLADNGYWNTRELATLSTDHPDLEVLVAPAGDRRVRNRPPPEVTDTSDLATMTTRFTDPDTQSRYRQRAASIEPIFAHIKTNRRLDRLLRRGLEAANHEWQLICTAHNLTKLHTARA
jgi:transposase